MLLAVASRPLCDSRSAWRGSCDQHPGMYHPGRQRPVLLPAATRLHDHVFILLIDHVVGGVNEEDADGTQPRGHTAGGWRGLRVHGVHQGLDDCMVRGLQVGAQGELA